MFTFFKKNKKKQTIESAPQPKKYEPKHSLNQDYLSQWSSDAAMDDDNRKHNGERHDFHSTQHEEIHISS